MLKRLFVILLMVCFIIGNYSYSSYISYADTPSSVMTDADMVDAFKAYCKSRDLTIEGSIADAVTKFTTDTYNSIVNKLGIDPSQLQAEISKIYENDVLNHYAFTALGINGFNRIFAQFLQDNNLSVGATDVDQTLFSGKYFTDVDGNKAFIYVFNNITTTFNKNISGNILTYGSWYKYQPSYFRNNNIDHGTTFLFDLSESFSVFNIDIYIVNNSVYHGYSPDASGGAYMFNAFADSPQYKDRNGSFILYLSKPNDSYLRLGTFSTYISGQNKLFNLYSCGSIPLSNIDTITDTDINVVSPQIKEPLPDDEPVDIQPDGTIVEPVVPPGPRPTPWPDYHPQTPINPDGDGGFNIDWDLDFPDLNIDWSIDGLINKFPFSIPHDVYLLCSTLNAEPVTPVIQGTIDLKIHQWQIDWDLHQFDNLASLLRKLEILLFLIGLIMITRNIIKG